MVFAEHGGCLSSVDNRELRIWNEDTSVRLAGGECGTSAEFVGMSVRFVVG